jgi:glycosyltransferase involved in cell wall biosynthesis
LRRCLESITPQLLPGDEIIVVGDQQDGPLPGVEALVTGMGFHYLPYEPTHMCWGHCAINYALPYASGSHIHLNDDDDIWTPNARDLMRRATNVWPDSPLLFQFESYYARQVFWVPGYAGFLQRDYIGGHCLLAPNIEGKVGRYTCVYNGDFDYVESTVNNFGGPGKAIWISEKVAIARP